jgi:hypothetical protein
MTNTKIIKTETLLHLNFRIFLLFSSLCLSNANLAYHSLVHYPSLFSLLTSLALFLFVCFFCFFPFSLPSLLSLSSQASILDITIVIIRAKQY